MNIEVLKSSIEKGVEINSFLIFVYKDIPFIANQYVTEIAKQQNKTISYIDSLKPFTTNSNSLFGEEELNTDCVTVFNCDEFTDTSIKLLSKNNLFVITKKVNKNSLEIFKDCVIEIPKLENWQIKDYVYSLAEGVDTYELDWLCETCGYNIYRLDSELSKLTIFQPNERKYVFKALKDEGAFSDVSAHTVFNITNSVTNKDIQTLHSALREIKSFDAEPLGVVTLLYNGFKKLIQVWLARNPTPENTGLKQNVIYAINKSPRVYTKQQLLKCFLVVSDIDKKLKTGFIEIPWLIDYLVCKVLTC